MNLKARKYVESQKLVAKAKQAARLAYLRQKGLEPQAVQRDAALRSIKAAIRHADGRLAAIAAQEKLIQDLARAKAEKLAAREAPPEKPAEPVAEKKGKKEKKEKPAKAEKQGKEPKKGKEGKKGGGEPPEGGTAGEKA